MEEIFVFDFCSIWGSAENKENKLFIPRFI